MPNKIESFSFDNFTVTDENKIPFLICQAVSTRPEPFGMVIISLPSDEERFHLKWALQNVFTAGGRPYLSVSIEDIVADIQDTGDLLFYIEPQILVIDDLELIPRRYSTQNELYNLLKVRLENKKTTLLLSEFDYNRLELIMIDRLFNFLKHGCKEKMI